MAVFGTCSAISVAGSLLLDEAHHAAPSERRTLRGRQRIYPRDRGLAERFEHRLFLSATPHNGHSNSFSSLLEILDPQRFTRGVPVRPRELDAVMVRRLKSDLRYFGEKFPKRIVDPIRIDGLPNNTPELVLSRKLAEYGESSAPGRQISPRGKLAMCGSPLSACSNDFSHQSPPSRRRWRSIARGSFAPTSLCRRRQQKNSSVAVPGWGTSPQTK